MALFWTIIILPLSASASAIFLRLSKRPGPTIVDTVAARRNLPWIAPTYLGPYRSA